MKTNPALFLFVVLLAMTPISSHSQVSEKADSSKLKISIKPPVLAEGGHTHGNGGDAFAQEFVDDARILAQFLTTRDAKLLPHVDSETFLQKLDEITVSSVGEVLYLDGVPKDLINYPRENSIVLSRPRWASIPDRRKLNIILHEMLWMLGIPDRKYENSWAILEESNLGHSSLDHLTTVDQGDMKSWSLEFSDIVREALKNGYIATTMDQEEAILVGGIQSALTVGTPEFQKYFVSTLNAALADIEVYSQDREQQVYLLRNYLKFSLSDLDYLNSVHIKNDQVPFAASVLKRALLIAASSKTDIEEIDLLNHAIDRADDLLAMSTDDTRPNTCALEQLHEASVAASDDSIDIKTKIQILRKSVAKAARFQTNCPQP